MTTNDSTEHTPTPWRMFGTSIGALGHGAICRMVDGPASDAPALRVDSHRFEVVMRDAAFIVRACNSHDALLAAATEIIEVIDAIAGVSDLDRLDIVAMNRLERRWAQAPNALRAAIAAAKGEGALS